MIDEIIEAMNEKKANDIVILNLKNLNSTWFNYFIVCHGNSIPQVQTITENIQKTLRNKLKVRPHHIEGTNNYQWVLMDYGEILVHIFLEEARKFYRLEELWADALVETI